MQIGPIFLVFAFALSWPRFAMIFHTGTVSGLATAPPTMVASAVALSALGLAVTDHGIVFALLLTSLGLLFARVLPARTALAPVMLSAVSFAIYLHLS